VRLKPGCGRGAVNRHEIPTHLNVEDKAFAGLTMAEATAFAIFHGLV